MALAVTLPLSDEDRTLWGNRLAEAQTAYHDLATGQAVASFTDQNGERVTYSKTQMSSLAGYISEIVSLLGTPATARTSTHPRPMRFIFGR